MTVEIKPKVYATPVVIEGCEIIVRQMFDDKDFNRLVSIGGKLPDGFVPHVKYKPAFTIFTEAQLNELKAAGVKVKYE